MPPEKRTKPEEGLAETRPPRHPAPATSQSNRRNAERSSTTNPRGYYAHAWRHGFGYGFRDHVDMKMADVKEPHNWLTQPQCLLQQVPLAYVECPYSLDPTRLSWPVTVQGRLQLRKPARVSMAMDTPGSAQ